jgi:hypothetical protein
MWDQEEEQVLPTTEDLALDVKAELEEKTFLQRKSKTRR